MKRYIIGLLGFFSMELFSQNITDLAVMNEQAVEIQNENNVQISSVDDSVFINPDRIRYDQRCIQIEGQDVFVFSGAFHYFRVPRPLWRDRFRKLKEGGFNCVETYIPWNWHERCMPCSPKDDSCLDMEDLVEFLQLAEEFGLYVILRPGPYICAEWSGGGFPQWLMQKKPARTTFDVWLQSADPEFIRWTEHWYRAVCHVVAPYQLTRKAKGETGIILFQIENEFNRVKWFSKETKKDYLAQLAQIVRKNGIDVPIITCWTDEARNVGEGVLNGVVDMVNSYPRFAIEKNFGRQIARQLQMGGAEKPLICGELQGGWMSEVGGKLSWEQEGLLPVQTQNITLYALQHGFCGINYYMTVGGTNIDDWGARQMTQTYDYAAAIAEDGSTNERYRRFQGLGRLLQEHGTRIARANAVSIEYISTDPDVKLALRQAVNGDRYYFVRTEEHTRQHFGTLQTEDLTLDFALEPFGSLLYYLPAGANKGDWLPKLPDTETRPIVKADTICLAVTSLPDPLPTHWSKLKKGETIDHRGIYGRHFIYYRTQALQGRLLEVGRIGHKLINGTDADEVLLTVGGKRLTPIKEETYCAYYQLPGDSTKKDKVEIIMLFDSKGLHHHTKKEVEDYWGIGPNYMRCAGKDLPLEYAYTEYDKGISFSQGGTGTDIILTANNHLEAPSLLNWYSCSFTLPMQPAGVWFPYYFRLEHTGNGFIYLNGHCLGRCYEKGPQQEYYLPECWLNFGGENRLILSMYPTGEETAIKKAEIIPVTWKAEKRSKRSASCNLK